MLWLWILLAVVVLLALLCWTRVGVWAALDGEGVFRLDAKVGFFRVHILPAKAKKEEKGEREPKKAKKPKEKSGQKRKLSFTLEDGKDAFHSLMPPLKRALGRTRRGVRVEPLRVSLVLGGQEDPASTAQLYGELQAAVWAGMPVAERLIDIPDPRIHTGVDFESDSTAVEGEAGVAFRMGTLMAIGFGLAVPALKWFLRWQKRCKTRPPEVEKKPPFWKRKRAVDEGAAPPVETPEEEKTAG